MSQILTFEEYYRHWMSRIIKLYLIASIVTFFFMLVLSSSNLTTERVARETNFYDLIFSYMSLVLLGALGGLLILIVMYQIPKYFKQTGDVNE